MLLTTVQAPHMNAICERLVAATFHREFLDRVLILEAPDQAVRVGPNQTKPS